MRAYIRPLSICDLRQCVAVESAAFPAEEAAPSGKIEYRLSTCPELCYGVFVQDPSDDLPEAGGVPLMPSLYGPDKDLLVAHILSTKSNSPVVTDQDMAYPPSWRSNLQAGAEVGHQPTGTTIALHCLAVSPTHQRSGLGTNLMNIYIEQMRQTKGVDRISLLTYDRLIPYYQKLGFELRGKSNATYAGLSWNNLTYDFIRGE